MISNNQRSIPTCSHGRPRTATDGYAEGVPPPQFDPAMAQAYVQMVQCPRRKPYVGKLWLFASPDSGIIERVSVTRERTVAVFVGNLIPPCGPGSVGFVDPPLLGVSPLAPSTSVALAFATPGFLVAVMLHMGISWRGKTFPWQDVLLGFFWGSSLYLLSTPIIKIRRSRFTLSTNLLFWISRSLDVHCVPFPGQTSFSLTG